MFNRIVLAVLLLTCQSTFASANEKNKPVDALDGKWQVNQWTYDGVDVPLDKLEQPLFFEIEGDKWRFDFEMSNKPVRVEFSASLAGDEPQHTFDARMLKGRSVGKICKGICSRKGDEIRLCLPDLPSIDRPAKMESTENSRLHYYVLTRVRE